MIIFQRTLLALLFSFFTAISNAASQHPEIIAEQLQQKYDSMKSLEFKFHQWTSGEMTGRPRQGSGQAIFLRNNDAGKMRWDYTTPDIQVLLSDGKTFSMYFANLQQMIVSPASVMKQDLTYAFFTGGGNLRRDFEITEADDEYSMPEEKTAGQLQTIKLIPKKPQSQVQDIHLWVTPDNLVRRINIRDYFGTITSLNLSDIIINSLEKKSPAEINEFFHFTPPEGTEIIEQF